MSVESWSLVAQMVAALVAAIAAVASWRAANASRDTIRDERDERRLAILSELHAALLVLATDLKQGNRDAFLEHRPALERLTGLYGRAIRGIGDVITTNTTDIKELTDGVDRVLKAVTHEIWDVGHPPGPTAPPPRWRPLKRRRWLAQHPPAPITVAVAPGDELPEMYGRPT